MKKKKFRGILIYIMVKQNNMKTIQKTNKKNLQIPKINYNLIRIKNYKLNNK